MKKIFVIAHRGASAYAPENTFPAFELAVKMGSCGIETDIHVTKDNIPILIHDATVDRTTNGTGCVNDLTLDEIKKLDAGSWFSPAFAGVQIPTLEEFLKRFGGTVHLVLEIKDKKATEKTLTLVRDLGLLDDSTFISFNIEVLKEIIRLESNANVGFLTNYVDKELIKMVKDSNIKQICPYAPSLTESIVEIVRAYGLDIRVWGVDTEDIIERMIKFGIYTMTVNFPDKLIEALKKYGIM
ncbi:MAG: glycerophosphodiester phosphodiesterase family protein [bacterium]|nr:glycerophosphodiester phosphodiesterase family protein [bacterium]